MIVLRGISMLLRSAAAGRYSRAYRRIKEGLVEVEKHLLWSSRATLNRLVARLPSYLSAPLAADTPGTPEMEVEGGRPFLRAALGLVSRQAAVVLATHLVEPVLSTDQAGLE